MNKFLLIILMLILIIPSSSAYLLHGTILDNSDNVVPYADVKIECQSYFEPIKTDKFGSFVVELNKSPCIVSAMYGDYVGYKEVRNVAEDYIHVDIKADKLILRKRVYIYIIILIIVLVLISFYMKRKSKIVEKEVRIKEIVVPHLKEKEKLVVEALKKKEGQTTQATLRVITDLSKADLSAILKELETRKIIHKEKQGNKNIITLKEGVLNKIEQDKE